MNQLPDPTGVSTDVEKLEADQHLDERLDEALAETFPASDPVAVHEPRTETSAGSNANQGRRDPPNGNSG